MKYPFVILFRYDTYSFIDIYFEQNKDDMLFSITIINNKKGLNKLFNCNNQLLITYGNSEDEYLEDIDSMISYRMKLRWNHFKIFPDIHTMNSTLNYGYMTLITEKAENLRPIFSLFTTCFNSYDKIYRAYNSIKSQTLKDWEWVILDDSPNDEHFQFLRKTFADDCRIRLYKRSENNGSIGNVKNEAVLLCRGKYVLEMDHDDELLPDCLSDATIVFESDPNVGFVYMDFANVYEDWSNFNYGDFFALGYSGYYCQKYKNQWVYVCSTPNINNITLSHIVGVPNHPRIWRKDTLIKIGNYSEFLPISDDYEVLLRTAVHTKMAKVNKLSYIQYMNRGNNNFSLIRNSEINRLCRLHLYPQCFEKYNIHDVMQSLGAFEDKKYLSNYTQIWRRENYQHKYCNLIINLDHKKQYGIFGLDTFIKYKNEIRELYNDETNDFVVLDNYYELDELIKEIEDSDMDRIRCYKLNDSTDEELIRYFHLIYRSSPDYHIYFEPPKVFEEKQSDTKITIITPCIRPDNLKIIEKSINFDYINEWIIVYDEKKITENPYLFRGKNDKIKEYLYSGDGISGNPQRNYALSKVENEDTYIYFLDDDNIVHPKLYNLLHVLEPNKIYTFNQTRPDYIFPFKSHLLGNNISVYNIDSAMFLVYFKLCKDIRWDTDKYNSDGYYITECYEKNKDAWEFVNKTLAYYNKIN
jgi:glycosyltransferase involved in cell wall biosynthesis